MNEQECQARIAELMREIDRLRVEESLAIEREIRELWRQGKRIEAVKEYRAAAGCTLQEARHVLHAIYFDIPSDSLLG